jgi:outer membrane protein assembly factor BamB
VGFSGWFSFDGIGCVQIEYLLVKTAPGHTQFSIDLCPTSLGAARHSDSFVRSPAWDRSHARCSGTRRSRWFVAALIPALLILAAPVSAQQPPPDKDEGATTGSAGRSRRDQRRNSDDRRAEPGAKSQSALALPFKTAWQYLSGDVMKYLPPAMDSSRVYLPLAKGNVVCLDLRGGALLWSSELGGDISVPVAVGKAAIYVVREQPSADQSQSTGSITALDPITGLALWAHDYPRPFTSQLSLDKDRLYIGSADGALYAISAANGEVSWKAQTGDVVHGRPLVTDDAVYFGSDDGAVRKVTIDHGNETWKYQTRGKVTGCPVLDDARLYFGSQDDWLYCVDISRNKLKWKSRAGAGWEGSPVLIGNRLLIGSLDNFLYAISTSRGDRIWKRRLDNRIISCPIVDGDTVLVSYFRAGHVAMFLNADGRRVNYYQVNKGSVIVADPVYSDGVLLVIIAPVDEEGTLQADKGLVVAVAERAQDSKEAVKKTP